MWICKHCEMQNEDWENECYLCGKPLKEPDPVVVNEEKKTSTAERIAQDPAYKEVQPSVDDFASAFAFSVPETEEYETVETDMQSDDSDFEDVSSEYTDIEEPEIIENPAQDYLEPLSDDVLSEDSSDDDMKIFIIDPPLVPEEPVAPPVSPVREKSAKDESFSAFVKDLFAVSEQKRADEQERPVFAEPEKTEPSVFAEPGRTEFDLNQFLSQIQQNSSDNITEEIRRKQEERKNQEPPADADSAQTKEQQRAVKKEIRARHRHETVAMFSKMTKQISLSVIAVFLLLTAAFLGVCVWRGHAENVPYVLDEIFYMFELQLREFLETMQF